MLQTCYPTTFFHPHVSFCASLERRIEDGGMLKKRMSRPGVGREPPNPVSPLAGFRSILRVATFPNRQPFSAAYTAGRIGRMDSEMDSEYLPVSAGCASVRPN